MPQPKDFSTPREYRLWATTMLAVYSEAAEQNIKTSEDLISQAVEFREQAMLVLERAQAISTDLARFLDSEVGTDIE